MSRLQSLGALVVAPLTCLLVLACDTPIDPPDLPAESASPVFTVIGGDNPEGAIVLNKGAASEPFTGSCTFAGRVTEDVTLVRRPNGGGLLSCHWEEFFPAGTFDRAQTFHGFGCTLNFVGSSFSTKSHFVLARSGVANMHCTFEEIL